MVTSEIARRNSESAERFHARLPLHDLEDRPSDAETFDPPVEIR